MCPCTGFSPRENIAHVALLQGSDKGGRKVPRAGTGLAQPREVQGALMHLFSSYGTDQ